jgi:hypothetical protein
MSEESSTFPESPEIHLGYEPPVDWHATHRPGVRLVNFTLRLKHSIGQEGILRSKMEQMLAGTGVIATLYGQCPRTLLGELKSATIWYGWLARLDEHKALSTLSCSELLQFVQNFLTADFVDKIRIQECVTQERYGDPNIHRWWELANGVTTEGDLGGRSAFTKNEHGVALDLPSLEIAIDHLPDELQKAIRSMRQGPPPTQEG